MVHVTVRALKIIIPREAVVIALVNIENWFLRGFNFPWLVSSLQQVHLHFIELFCAYYM